MELSTYQTEDRALTKELSNIKMLIEFNQESGFNIDKFQLNTRQTKMIQSSVGKDRHTMNNVPLVYEYKV